MTTENESSKPIKQVPIKPEMLRWACIRSGRNIVRIHQRFPVDAWIRGTKYPTIKELDKFAKFVYIPLGYLFLDEPLEEPLPKGVYVFRGLTLEGLGN